MGACAPLVRSTSGGLVQWVDSYGNVEDGGNSGQRLTSATPTSASATPAF
jgi:hypothetical protein